MIEYRLYLELVFIGVILQLFLFTNNIFLYKQKIRGRISLMLIFGIAMGVFELIWVICEEHNDLGLNVITYIGGCGYCIAFMVFSVLLDLYLIDRLGLKPGKRAQILIYGVPLAVFVLITISSQLTHLVIWMGEDGIMQYGPLFEGLFLWLVLAYLLAPAFLAVYFLTIGKNKRPADGEISPSMFVFSIMVPAFYFLEIALINDSESPYQTMSLPVSLALLYLITNVSTHTALKTRAQMESVETDLRIASKIQADALPPVAPEFADHLDLNLRGSMNTAKEVGGDFYDYFTIDENRLCFLIADVSGKGTPAALFMMTAMTMIKDYALTHESTAEIFTAVNARLCENNDQGMFATAWIGIVDTRTMTLQYTNAGHNCPFFLRRGKPCEPIKDLHGLFLAGLDFTQYKQDEIQLQPGDRILLYTDGVTEAHDRENNLYGEERLQEVLERTRECPGEEVLEQVFEDVNDYARGVPQFDDITMIILTIKE